MKINDQPIVVEQTFDCSVERLWSALTDLAEMHQWFFNSIPDFKAEVGFSTSFDVQSTERTFKHNWLVKEVVPNKRLTINWTFTGHHGSSNTIFELSDDNGKSKLVLTAVVLEPHPTDIPEFKRESGVEGWKYFINGNLPAHIQKG